MIQALENKQLGPKRTFRDKLFDYSCQRIGKKRTKLFFKLYDLAKFDLFGKPKGAFGSIDITNRCNLRCKHCYFYAHDYEEKPELTDDEWIEKLESLKETDFPLYQCSWIGGEPLLRKDLIERGMKYFKSNLVATNGTIELPNCLLRRRPYAGCVDRPTRNTHWGAGAAGGPPRRARAGREDLRPRPGASAHLR